MMSVTEEVAAWMAASLVGGSNIWPCQKCDAMLQRERKLVANA